MKYWRWLLVAALAAALAVMFGCGGGGGGGTPPTDDTGNTPNTYPLSGVYIEFMNGTTRLDPLNLKVGDSGTVVLASFTPDGSRFDIPASGWTTIGAGSPQFVMDTNGNFTVAGNPGAFFQVEITASVGGSLKTYDQDVHVATGTTRINGHVLAEAVLNDVRFVQVEFYDAGGTKVGAARSFGNGLFTAYADNAVWMSIKPETINVNGAGAASGFYRMIRYHGISYSTDSSCRVPIGPFTVGSSNNLPYTVYLLLQSAGPPPFPTGCAP